MIYLVCDFDIDESISGVSTTVSNLVDNINHDLDLVTPTGGIDIGNGITLDWKRQATIKDILRTSGDEPYAIHLMDEGPMALSFLLFCKKHKIKFTTSYLTRWNKFLPLVGGIAHRYCEWFHRQSAATMVASDHVCDFIKLDNPVIWPKGVNSIFRPDKTVERKYYTYIGRVSAEKEIDRFLSLPIGPKMVVGDGPMLEFYKKKYTNVKYTGYLHGENLVKAYQESICTVFTSRADTFGLTIIESLACGTPVASTPESNIWRIVGNQQAQCCRLRLIDSVKEAHKCSEEECLKEASKYSWQNSTKKFESNLVWNK
jgi:glycosyltransferase involved in cell wall biosynthesis